MASLLDIVPSQETVTIGKETVVVTGLSALGIASLIDRFPEVKALFVEQETQIDGRSIMQLAPTLVAAILAAGLGHPGDEKAEAVAGKLPIGVQLEAIEKIIAVSAPGGVNPLLESVARLSGLLHTNDSDADQSGGALAQKVPATN